MSAVTDRADARSVRAQPDRAAPRRQRPHGALQLAARARSGRHVHPAHRGHRLRALDARVGARASSRTCGGWGSTGTRASRPAATTARTGSPSGCTSTARTPWSCCRAARRITASAPPSSSKPIGRRRSPRAGRRSTSAAAATIPRDEARRRIEDGEKAVIRFRVPDGPRRRVRRRRARRGALQHRRHRRSGAGAVGRRARLQLRRRHRRCADGDHARGPRRGSHLEHAAAGAAVRGVRLDAAGVRARVAGDGARSRAAVEAARRHVGGRVPRARLPAGGADQLPGADRLVAGRRRGAAAARRAGARASGSRTSATAPACSTSRSWRG